MNRKVDSHLEDLPDELLLDIFMYLSPRDLFLSFAYLNHRFNSILCDQTIQLGLQITNTDYPNVDYFADYFTHLYVCHDTINIRQFSNICSLTLGPSPRPTDELLSQLVDYPSRCFPALIQLTVYQPLSTWYSPPSLRLWTQLFTNQFSPHLQRCSLPGRIFAVPNTCFYCRSLRGLSIGGCSLRDLPTLLSVLPNLRYLSTDVWGTADKTNISAYHHINLSHLYIRFSQQTIVLEEIRCLLSHVPCLKRFTIEGKPKHETFDVDYWYEVLKSQLEYLKDFSCTIRLADTVVNENLDINYIRTYDWIFSQMNFYRRNDSLFISNQ